jgi:hypothetical protein
MAWMMISMKFRFDAMKATDLYAIIGPMKERVTLREWLVLVTVLAHPEGIGSNEIFKTNWCGREGSIRTSLNRFARLGLVSRELRPQPKQGRPFIIFKPLPKGFNYLGLTDGVTNRNAE